MLPAVFLPAAYVPIYKERLIGVFKERTGFLNSPTGVEQQIAFIGNMYDKPKILIGF